MPWAVTEPDIEALTQEAFNLLHLEIDELYAVLGCQLLGSAPPTRTADLVAHLFDLNAAQTKERGQRLKSPKVQLTGEIATICNALKADGGGFVEAMRGDFRKGLSNEDVFHLVDHVDESKMQILIMIVSAILKIPTRFESISATLAAMLCKSILRDVCR